ncbi:Uncharacterised protein [Salmonella enterica subsp. enterica serovar Bovismorbificans]|nr:Uncharacterised protein [Salmonella enterica subsp. enterica serovar Bovismorbificans]
MVVAKFGSFPSASANSFSVSSVSGTEPTRAAINARTKAALAISRPVALKSGVGVVGVPASAGLFSGAFSFTSSMTVLTAFGVAASASLSLSVALQSCTSPFSVVVAFVAFRPSTICCALSRYPLASCALFLASFAKRSASWRAVVAAVTSCAVCCALPAALSA